VPIILSRRCQWGDSQSNTTPTGQSNGVSIGVMTASIRDRFKATPVFTCSGPRCLATRRRLSINTAIALGMRPARPRVRSSGPADTDRLGTHVVVRRSAGIRTFATRVASSAAVRSGSGSPCSRAAAPGACRRRSTAGRRAARGHRVPTIAMISSAASPDRPPRTPGTTTSCATGPQCGRLRNRSATTRKCGRPLQPVGQPPVR
jgi:hypothetical protein